jgi:hypothetical protein
MNHGHFDALTRSLVGGLETRRGMLRLLAGSSLIGLAARFDLTEDAEARKKHPKRKTRDERERSGAVQSEGKKSKGKGKGKGKGKQGKDKSKDKDESSRDCGPGKKPCPGGICVSQALCCPGERMCGGEVCQTGCCPDEYECPGGACIDPLEECCPGQKKCPGNICLPEDECCPNEDGCDDAVCLPGEKLCLEGFWAGECIPEDECCDLPPLCDGECVAAVCEGGAYTCQASEECGPPPPPPPTCEDEGPCRPGYVRAPNSCACLCPDGSAGCGGWCCPSDLYCNEGDNWNRLCRTADWQLSCPLGYRQLEGGFCTI